MRGSAALECPSTTCRTACALDCSLGTSCACVPSPEKEEKQVGRWRCCHLVVCPRVWPCWCGCVASQTTLPRDNGKSNKKNEKSWRGMEEEQGRERGQQTAAAEATEVRAVKCCRGRELERITEGISIG